MAVAAFGKRTFWGKLASHSHWSMARLMRLAYPVHLERHSDTVVATFPDIPEALTEGATEDEALAEAKDCLVAALGGYVQDGQPIPVPSQGAGTTDVALPELVAAKVALYEAARARQLDVSALALRLGYTRRAVRRLLDVDGPSRLHEVETALGSLGDHMQLGVRPA